LEFAIEGHGLEKSFVRKRGFYELLREPFARAERVHALRGVDLAVREGEIFALLGPNGAGKTTLLKIFSSLILPDQGHASVAGHDTIHENLVKRHLGLVNSDERSFYWRLTARQNLRFFARLYDVPGRRIDSRIDELLTRVEMTDAADRPFSGYSAGMKQRIAIARALLHDPPILLMDEPTSSLDPASARKLRKFVLDELNGRDGKTVVLASHNLREVEVLAHRVAILVAGKMRQLGTVDEVRLWGVQQQRYRLTLSVEMVPAGPFEVLEHDTVDGRHRFLLALEPQAGLPQLLDVLHAAGIAVFGCDRVEPDLEEAFSRIVDADDGPREGQ
jgi:ABC-2 type transport system ATP-binding protein